MPNRTSSVGLEASDFKGISDLTPLPSPLNSGLPIIAALSFASFFASFSLFTFLCWRLYTWRRKGSQGYNQFVVLIMNLLLADMQQSLGFAFSLHWVINNGISSQGMACSIQAWLIGSGDLASGVWCLFIGLHTASAVIFGLKFKPVAFYSAILLAWAFIYSCNIIQLGLQSERLYVRAGAWCWVNQRYVNLRLYTHYLWIFVAELGVVGTYAMIFLIILHRIRSGYFKDEASAKQAKDVARLMAVYPLVYVFCTLPLASARTAAMAGNDVPAVIMVFAGAMITSNGWLDVLLYTMTRRILIFSDSPPSEDYNLDTFSAPWMNDKGSRFGTVTVITAGGDDRRNLIDQKPSDATPLQRLKSKLGRHKSPEVHDLESNIPDWLEDKEGLQISITSLDRPKQKMYTSGNIGGYSGSSPSTDDSMPPPTPTKDAKFLQQIRRKSRLAFPPRGSSRKCPKKHARGVSLDRIRELLHTPRSSISGRPSVATPSDTSVQIHEPGASQRAVSEHTINIYMGQSLQATPPPSTISLCPSSLTSQEISKGRPIRPKINTNFSHLDRTQSQKVTHMPEPFPLPVLKPSESSINLRRAVLGGRRETTIEIVSEAARPEDLVEMEEFARSKELVTPASARPMDEADKMEFLSTPDGMK